MKDTTTKEMSAIVFFGSYHKIHVRSRPGPAWEHYGPSVFVQAVPAGYVGTGDLVLCLSTYLGRRCSSVETRLLSAIRWWGMGDWSCRFASGMSAEVQDTDCLSRLLIRSCTSHSPEPLEHSAKACKLNTVHIVCFVFRRGRISI